MVVAGRRGRGERGVTMLQLVITLNIATLGILAISQSLTPTLDETYQRTTFALRDSCLNANAVPIAINSNVTAADVCGGGSVEGSD